MAQIRRRGTHERQHFPARTRALNYKHAKLLRRIHRGQDVTRSMSKADRELTSHCGADDRDQLQPYGCRVALTAPKALQGALPLKPHGIGYRWPRPR